MGREYAVLSAKGEVLYRTESFDAAAVSEKVPFPGGECLCICSGTAEEREIEALQSQLREAQAANRAKETFLSSMSHDIRTPMNAIIGMTALAKKYIDEKARVSDALDKIETASGHLLSLINDVLDMSRINSGRMQLASERFSLSDLLHQTMTIVRPQIEQKGHTYRLEASGIDVENFYGDALRLRQVYVNVINNAVKYTEKGGHILISVSEALLEDMCLLVLRCRDNGIGMSEEFLSRIFEPFERVNSSTISRIEGTGLGMSIVQKIVEAMDGAISIESKLGEGTEVTIRVPLVYERETPLSARLAGRRVLILEADEELRDAYARYLDEYQVAHTIVASAAEAFDALIGAQFGGEDFSAVIIGRKQLDGNGPFDIAAYLHKAYPALTLLLANDDNWEEIEYQAGRSGIARFIPLPFFRKSLAEGLIAALSGDGDESSASLQPDLTGKRILLVEDNLINLEIAREILSGTNAQIDSAEDGQQAVDAFLAASEGAYSVIFMDVQMPVMDGYAATRVIRSSGREDAASIPIYAMTANTFAEDIAKARAAGMDGHIAKPIDIHFLMQVLSRLPG